LSAATYRARDDGTLDLATQAPESGTYAGVDPDGLFWSMTSKDPSQLEPFEVTFDVDRAGPLEHQSAATATLERYWSPSGATQTPVSEHGLVGVFVVPAGAPAKRPALITFGGSEGGLRTGQLLAEYYASLGYACLGLAYFGAPGVPANLAQVPLEYFGTAIDWLKGQASVDSTKIGVMGGSRGGELALLLGATYPELAAVVAVVPSGLVWGGNTSDGSYKAAWTLGGKDVPFMPDSGAMPTTTTIDGKTAYVDATMFLADLHAAPAEAVSAATIAVEKAGASILMLAGADDQMWSSCTLAKIGADRLAQAGHGNGHSDDFVCYPDTGHAILQPGLPTTNANLVFIPNVGGWFALGGTPVGTAHAERDADTRIRKFLRRTLGQ
jgi:dienelactone hydrolase